MRAISTAGHTLSTDGGTVKPLAMIIAAATLVAGCHSLDHYVQPYGKDTYRIDDGDAVSIANRYCTRSGKAMQPVGGGWDREHDSFTFTCVPRDELTSPVVQR